MFATAIWKYRLRHFRLLIYEDIKSSKLISMFTSTYISIEREMVVVCVTGYLCNSKIRDPTKNLRRTKCVIR